MDMDIKDCIADCRYYSGEEYPPFEGSSIMNSFWRIERAWCLDHGDDHGLYEEYKAYGGMDYPGIPNKLLGMIWGWWVHGSYSAKDAVKSIHHPIDEYLSIPSQDVCPKDKLPSETINKL